MIPDDQLIPICRSWARRLKHLVKHFSSSAEILDELTNEAYQKTKELEDIRLVHKTVMWRLIEYISSINKKMEDRRKQEFCQQEMPIDEMIEDEMMDRLRTAIQKLSVSDLTLLRLYFWDEQTMEKIGRRLKVSKACVCSRMHNVLARLQKELEK